MNSILPGILLAVNTDWLAPLWLLGIGLLVGALVLLLAWGLIFLLSRNWAKGIGEIASEGPLTPVLVLVALLGGFALCITPVTPYRQFWESIVRIPFAKPLVVTTVELAPSEVNRKVPFTVLREEVKSFSVISNRNIIAIPDYDNPNVEEGRSQDINFPLREVNGGNVPKVWEQARREKNPFGGNVENFYVTNLTQEPATVTFTYKADLVTPEVQLIPQAALFLAGAVAFYVLLRALFPKMGAIAVATAKDGVGQPLFLVVLFVGVVLLVLFTVLPYNTLSNEDIKIFKSATLSVTMILGILVALWTSSVSISEEIEGRTALTVLSKPVGRRQFVLGKFFGVLGPVLLLFIILGTANMALTSFKVLYDAREAGQADFGWRDCYAEMYSLLPNMLLVFLQTTVLASISVAISTRLPMLPNLIICATIYVVGNLLPQLVQSSVGKFEIVEFMSQFLALLFPVLTHFDVNVPIAAGKSTTLEYLRWSALYCVLYSSFAMLVALFLFEDRDVG